MKKQTAVEWLIEQICGDHTSEWNKQIEQAKAMEREQIEEAYLSGMDSTLDERRETEYYNETYKGGEQ